MFCGWSPQWEGFYTSSLGGGAWEVTLKNCEITGNRATGTNSGCGGGGAEVKSEVTTTTVGQQLIDLKKALDAGAINQQEYEQQRKKILNQK